MDNRPPARYELFTELFKTIGEEAAKVLIIIHQQICGLDHCTSTLRVGNAREYTNCKQLQYFPGQAMLQDPIF